tara:strand:+ start:7722 stop:8204 length:483 start_codon:yes stop_codon:yes gene_type:complete
MDPLACPTTPFTKSKASLSQDARFAMRFVCGESRNVCEREQIVATMHELGALARLCVERPASREEFDALMTEMANVERTSPGMPFQPSFRAFLNTSYATAFARPGPVEILARADLEDRIASLPPAAASEGMGCASLWISFAHTLVRGSNIEPDDLLEPIT